MNDGASVREETLGSFVQRLSLEFGGCTVEGVMRGLWVDRSDGQQYDDESIAVMVVCVREQLDDAKAAVIDIGRQLKQRAMYFEVRYYDGVQILEVTEA
jgi:hypothetical protein